MLSASFHLKLNKLVDATKILLEGRDSSHDLAHALRVMNGAIAIAHEEGVETSVLERVQVAALLHDLEDEKYMDGKLDPPSVIPKLLHDCGFADPEFIARTQHIIAHVSYSKEKKTTKPIHYDLDMAIVQDADRIEALGAIGIARCCIFAGARNETMEEMMHHMLTKLPDILQRIKTKEGKKIASRRYKLVEDFCSEMMIELK